jgi:hypothetical protein
LLALAKEEFTQTNMPLEIYINYISMAESMVGVIDIEIQK